MSGTWFQTTTQYGGIDEGKAEVEAIGVNHGIRLTMFRYNGEDAYHLIDEWIKDRSEQYFERWREEQSNPFDVHVSPAAVDMYRMYGLWPIGDTVRSGTWKYHWGLHRLSFSNLPKAWWRVLRYAIMLRVMRAEWAIDAFLQGGRDSLFSWLIVDPKTKSTEQVNQAIDAILKMPGNEEMARHFS